MYIYIYFVLFYRQITDFCFYKRPPISVNSTPEKQVLESV